MHDRVAQRQPQPSSSTNRHGGEKCLEHASQRLLIHAMAIVFDAEAHQFVLRARGNRDGRRAVEHFFQCIHCIHQQVHDDLGYMVSHTVKGRQLAIQVKFQRNAP